MTCVVCTKRRLAPEQRQVCQPCRTRLADHLAAIPDLAGQLSEALEPGTSHGQRVTGSREAPLPLRIDVLDLSLPGARPAPVHDPHGDQGGMLPVAARLDQWVRDWRDSLWPDHRLPAPTVAGLADWLRHRLDVACDRHPAVDEFADEMRQVVADLRGVLGLRRLRHRLPAPCPDCDMRTLYRDDGADYVECGMCHRLWTEAEYARLVIVAVEQGVA